MLWPETSARQAYPLYYSLARPFVLAVSPGNPARGLNLFSAVCGGLAIGLLTYVGGTAERQRPRRRTRGTAAGVLAHVLDAVGDRRSLCAAYRAGRRLSPRPVRVPAAAHPAAAGGVLRRLCRVLRQSPVDDPAPGAVHGIPARRASPATRPAAPEHRRSCAGDRTRGRPALRAQLSLCMDEHRRAVRLGRPRRNVLVRRDEGRLARHDDGRRRPERIDRTGSDVALGRTPAIRDRRADGRGAGDAPTLDHLAAVGAAPRHGVRHQHRICHHLQRRRSARLFPSGTRLHRTRNCRAVFPAAPRKGAPYGSERRAPL